MDRKELEDYEEAIGIERIDWGLMLLIHGLFNFKFFICQCVGFTKEFGRFGEMREGGSEGGKSIE